MTLFETLGGETALRAIIEDFVDRLFDDLMIGFFFRKADRERVKRFEYEHAAEWLGAGQAYGGRSLAQAHAAHPIRTGHFGRRLQILREVLAKHRVPEDIAKGWIAHQESLRSEVMGQKPKLC